MGSVTPPPAAGRPSGAQPASGATPAGGTLPPGNASSRYHFADRPVSMGPSGAAIVFTLVAAAFGAWLYFKAPSMVGAQSLQKYTGFESNMESVILKDCAPPGCAAIYLTPTIGKKSAEALPGAVTLTKELSDMGVEAFIVLGEEPLGEAVKRARGLRRTILFDPHGEWAKDSGIERAPYWIVWRTGGRVRLRSEEPVSAGDVAAALR